MLLKELILEKASPKEKIEGSYVAVKFSKESNKALKKFAKGLGIDNIIPSDKLHITVIYSRKPIPVSEMPHDKKEIDMVVQPDHLSIFPTQSKKNALVLELNAPQLNELHKELMDKYKLTYDYDEYKAHVTLSYDCGDFDPDTVDVDLSPVYGLQLVTQYHDVLQLDWAAKNT